MKRVILFFFVLFFFTSCSLANQHDEMKEFKTSEEILRFTPQIEDQDRSVSMENYSGSYVANSEEGLFFLLKGRVYYLPNGEDEAVELFTINHIDGKYSEDSAGSSDSESIYIAIDHGISYRDGKLYFLCMRSDGQDFYGYSIMSMKTDGSDLQVIHNIPMNSKVNPSRGFLHRNSFFYTEWKDFVLEESDEPLTAHQLNRLYLNRLEETSLELPFPVDRIYSLGNYLVFPITNQVELQKGNAVADYYVYDLSTNTVHPMDLEAFPLMGWFNDRIITRKDGMLISFDPSTGEIQEHFETKASNFLSDGEYLCLETWRDEDISGDIKTQVSYSVYDKEFNLYHETEAFPWMGDPIVFDQGKYFKVVYKPGVNTRKLEIECINLKEREKSFTTIIKTWEE